MKTALRLSTFIAIVSAMVALYLVAYYLLLLGNGKHDPLWASICYLAASTIFFSGIAFVLTAVGAGNKPVQRPLVQPKRGAR